MKKTRENAEDQLTDEERKGLLLEEVKEKRKQLALLIDYSCDLCLPKKQISGTTQSEGTSQGVLRLADEFLASLVSGESTDCSELEWQIHSLSVAIATHVKFNGTRDLLERLKMAVLPVEVAFRAVLPPSISIKYDELKLLMNTVFDFIEQVQSGGNIDLETAQLLFTSIPPAHAIAAAIVLGAIRLLSSFREVNNFDFYAQLAGDLDVTDDEWRVDLHESELKELVLIAHTFRNNYC